MPASCSEEDLNLVAGDDGSGCRGNGVSAKTVNTEGKAGRPTYLGLAAEMGTEEQCRR